MIFSSKASTPPYLAIAVFAAAFAALAQFAAPVAALASDTGPAATSAIAGYVFSQDGRAIGIDSYNSVDSGFDGITISNGSEGEYDVTFAGMAAIASKAVVQVSSASVGDSCAVSGWVPVGKALQATVDCFTVSTGAADNADFSLIISHPASPPNGTFDFALNTRANTSGTLTSFQFNSAHKQNSIKHLGTGKYQLTFGGPKTTGTKGIVKISPYGDQPGDCELVSWTGSAKGELVNVDCYKVGHVLADRDFIATYASASSIMGLKGQVVANAFANSKASVYQPADQYDSVKGAKVTVVHLATGEYAVFPAGSSGDAAVSNGNIQANTVGSRGRHCIAGSWEQELTPLINIECRDSEGNLVDSSFAVEWVVPVR